MEINFCRRCGTRLTPQLHGEYICEQGHHIYYKAHAAALVLLVNQRDEVLIAVRGKAPAVGAHDLPGGFCNPQETYEEAAIRELQEETGLLPGDYTDLEYLSDAVENYEFEGEQVPVLGVVFWGRTQKSEEIKATDDVAALMWVPLADVDFTKFSTDFIIARTALIKMQEHLGLRV